jgi:hypothetical protein
MTRTPNVMAGLGPAFAGHDDEELIASKQHLVRQVVHAVARSY